MFLKRSTLRKIILENLLLEAAQRAAVSAEWVFQQLSRGDRAIKGQKISGSLSFIKNIVNRGIVGSTGTIYKGADAVAYLAHRVLPRVYTATGGAPGSATSVKNTLTVIKHFAKEYNVIKPLLQYRVHSGPSYVGKLVNTKMGQSILNMMPKAGQSVKVAVQAAKSAGAIKAPAAKVTLQLTKLISAAKPSVTNAKNAGQAIKIAMNKSPEAVAIAKELGKKFGTSGAQITSLQGGTQATKAITASSGAVSNLSRFFAIAGKAAVFLMVADAFYQPYNLFANGELWGFKLGIGVKDMDTPWGVLAYRKRQGYPPAKPSDFNKQYKNVLATIIWNQKNKGEAGKISKEWTQRAIKEDLIDTAAWKAYLQPWRDAEKKIKEAEKILASKSEESTGADDLSDLGIFDEDAMKQIGKSDGGTGRELTSKTKAQKSEPGKTGSPASSSIQKIQKIINDGSSGKWTKDTNIKLGEYATVTGSEKVTTEPAGLEWWKSWKNSAPQIKSMSVAGKTMSFGAKKAGNPQLKGNLSSLLKVLEFIKDSRVQL